MTEFECDSNAVACPRLYPRRASGRTAPQDRAASGGRKYSNPSRAEIRIRIDVSSDTCQRIENRYAIRGEMEGARLAWTGKKYSNSNTSRI